MMRSFALLFMMLPVALSAQDEPCTVLGVQELTGLLHSIQLQMDAVQDSIEELNLRLSDLESGQGDLIHGHIDVDAGEELEWIVPDGVNLLEITISGGSGGTGQGTNACPYTGWSAQSGCSGGAGGQATVLVQVAEGDAVLIQAGSKPDTPSPLASCGIGQTGATGLPGSLTINGVFILSASGGAGGRGVWCNCGGDGYHGCGGPIHPDNPGVGGVTGPGIDTGAILTSVSLGGGACRIRY